MQDMTETAMIPEQRKVLKRLHYPTAKAAPKGCRRSLGKTPTGLPPALSQRNPIPEQRQINEPTSLVI
jgi:hypothetical protein